MTKIHKFLFREVDASSLAFFRIGFGLIMFVECLRHLFVFCLSCFYLKSDFLFTYYGFSWISPLPGSGLSILFVLMAIASIGIMLGYFYRICILFYTLAFSYIFLLDQTRYLNHFYMVILFSFLLCLIPANRYLALDARRNRAIHDTRIPFWPLFLLGAQLEIILIYAGIAKLNLDWLNLEPLRMWLAKSDDMPLLGYFFTQDWSIAIAAYGVIILHLVGAPLLLFKRTRLIVFLIYASFHTLNHFVFNIGIFPWFTLFASLVLFDPDWPKQCFAWLKNKWPIFRDDVFISRGGFFKQIQLPSSSKRAWIMAFIVVWIFIQIVTPLRHWIYPGDVAWNEEGHRFSWRMKLRDKRGNAKFHVYADGEEWAIRSRKYLRRKQIKKMACRPDMILQFAHFLGDNWSNRGYKNIRVTVDIRCSLNGRPRETFIKPNVNLYTEKRDLNHVDWILPLTEPLPNPWLGNNND